MRSGSRTPIWHRCARHCSQKPSCCRHARQVGRPVPGGYRDARDVNSGRLPIRPKAYPRGLYSSDRVISVANREGLKVSDSRRTTWLGCLVALASASSASRDTRVRIVMVPRIHSSPVPMQPVDSKKGCVDAPRLARLCGSQALGGRALACPGRRGPSEIQALCQNRRAAHLYCRGL